MSIVRPLVAAVLLLACGLFACGCSRHEARVVTLATTTSTRDSGLLDVLVPRFRTETGIDVKVVAVGTGQALELGRRGDADVLLVHAPDAEEAFMREGHGASRAPVMYNDFVIVGPKADPARAAGLAAAAALGRIAATRAVFVSRGDGSGTHQKEKALWGAAGVQPGGDGYKSVGQGMGETLRVASELGAYTLADRATFLAQRRTVSLVVLVEHDPALVNPYAAIVVDKGRHAAVHDAEARRFVAFLLEPETQREIATFRIADDGEPSFFVYPPDGGAPPR